MSKGKYAWRKEKKSYERIYKGITGKKTTIMDVPNCSNAIGYTDSNGYIYIAHNHPIMNGLNDNEKKIFRTGIFAHELLHQIFSDFNIISKTAKKLMPYEATIYTTIFNVIEDPHIEWRAPQVIGDTLLKSLRFTIRYTYQKSSISEKSELGFKQYINALIIMGDGGFIKGAITDPKVLTALSETASIFCNAVIEKEPSKRSEAALKIMEITRPLWEIEEEIEQLTKELIEEALKHDKEESTELHKEKKAEMDESEPSPIPRGELLELLKKMKESGELPELKSSPGSSGTVPSEKENSDSTSSDIKSHSTGSELEGEIKPTSDVSSDCESDLSTDEDEDESFSIDKESPSKEVDKTKDELEKISDEDSDENFSMDAEPEKSEEFYKSGKDDKSDKDFSDESIEEEYSTSPESEREGFKADEEISDMDVATREKDYSEALEEINSVLSKINAEVTEEDVEVTSDDVKWLESMDKISDEQIKKEETAEEDTSFDDSISQTMYEPDKFSVYNANVINKISLAKKAKYDDFVASQKKSITAFSKRLIRIFANDTDEKERKKTGKINIRRVMDSKVTARIFDKKNEPKNIKDLAVCIVLDESGSMNSCITSCTAIARRIDVTRQCAIFLAESLALLNIPTYIMGFSADEKKDGRFYDATHYHYIKWKNTKKERYSLTSVQARYNNFDGISINYASEILNKYRSTHKLMIVISDGEPCSIKSCGTQGIVDVKEAIRKAKKSADVVGIAIGESSTSILHEMYGKDFMHINSLESAYFKLADKISKVIKLW